MTSAPHETGAGPAAAVGGATAGQVVVMRSGETVMSRSVGEDALGRSLDADSVIPFYCVSRSITGLVAASLDATGVLPLSAALADTGLDLHRSLRPISIEALLDHSAGLVAPPAMIGIIGHGIEGDALLSSIQGPGPEIDGFGTRETGYGEFAGGYIVQELLNRILPVPIEEHLRAIWSGSPDDDRFLTYRPDWLDRWQSLSIAPTLAYRDDRQLALSIEATEVFAKHYLATGGMFGTIELLAAFFDALGRAAGGEPVFGPGLDGIARTVAESRGVYYDRGLNRTCGFGLGVMTDLATHGFGDSCSSAAFGALGLMGVTFVVCDPASGLTVAAHRVDYDTAGDGHIAWRQAVIREVLSELGESG